MKKNIKLIVLSLLVVIFSLMLCACGSCNKEPKPSVQTEAPFELVKTSAIMIVGEEAQLPYYYTIEDDGGLRFVSSAPNVAQIEANGNIKALNPGNATITCTHGEYVKTFEVTVETNGILPTLEFQDVNNYEGENNVQISDSASVKPTVMFNGKKYNDFTARYVSSDESKCTVSDDGVVTALSEGEVTVTVYVKWRWNQESELTREITFNIVSKYEVFFGDTEYNFVDLYLVERLGDKNYQTEIDLNTLSVKLNGVDRTQTAVIEVLNNQAIDGVSDVVSYEGQKVTAIASGTATLKVSLGDNGNNYNKLINLKVRRPIQQVSGTSTFNSYEGVIENLANYIKGDIESAYYDGDEFVGRKLEVNADNKITYNMLRIDEPENKTFIVYGNDNVGYAFNLDIIYEYIPEPGVVAPFNAYSATNYMDIDTGKTAYTASVNSDANYTYGDEAYSLKLSRTSEKDGGAAFYYKNCIITDLNAKDAEGNYLYNYMTFSIYVDHHGYSDVSIRVGGNSYKNEATNTWLTYLITRDGKSENFAGGVFDDKVLVSDLNTFNIAVWQNAGKAIDVYFSAVRVGTLEAEPNVVAPFNTNSATNYIFVDTAKTHYTASVNSDANYTYGDEAYSLKLSRTSEKDGGAAFYYKNCIITDLNAKDAEGNYLYNYMTFSIYVDHHGSSDVSLRVGGNSYKTVATNTWLTYLITRDGKTENFDGGIFNDKVLVSDLNTFNIAVWQNAGNPIDVYFSAVRVGSEITEPNVAVPFNMQSGVNFVTLEKDGSYTISNGLPVDGEGQPIKYNGEETALKLVPKSDHIGGQGIILKASLIDLNVKEGESYKYNTITFGVYIKSQLPKEDIGVFSWYWQQIETNKWVTLSFNRDGQTNNFICNNSAFTGSKEITSLINTTLGIYIDGVGQSDAFYVSAIRVN